MNLTENELDQLKALENKGGPESPEELALDERLKNEIVHGTPLNGKHAGMANLSPLERD